MFSAKTWLAEKSKTCICTCFFLRFQLVYLQKYRLDFFHQGFSGQLYLSLRSIDKHIPKYVPCIRNLIGWNWPKCNFLSFFARVKLIFCKSTGWILTIKISQDSLIISEGESEFYFRLSTLLRSHDNLIMPRIVEINGGINICREPSKIRLKTLFSFF